MEDEKKMKEETVTVSKSRIYQGMIVLLVIALGASIWTGGFGFNKQPTTVPTPSPTPTPTPAPTPQQPQPNPAGAEIPAQSLLQVTTGQASHSKIGNDSAPVVIIEFSDFQCPFCRKFYTDSFASIENEFIKTNNAQLIYRHFPLNFHPMAPKSAEAAECANEQGKFKEFHDGMYNFQNVKDGGTVRTTIQYTIDDIKAEAAKISGLAVAKFNECLDSNKYAEVVTSDFNTGIAAGVQGTPTSFIGKRNGNVQKIVGACPFDTFQKAITAELGGKKWSADDRCQVVVS